VPRRYCEAEALLREVAAGAGLPLVLAHWILWDHQRHGVGDCTRARECPLAAPPGSESIRLIGSLFSLQPDGIRAPLTPRAAGPRRTGS
jgi:hypothetical protein